jgi:FAD/FMN-containing dehydrogenase
MRGVRIDPETRTACIQGGATTGDLQIEASRYNLAAVGSLFSGNGVGFILGGGVGHLARRAGHASDNVLSVELVTAAGEVVVASPEENPDLFWAVRGTQGNFGIVTGLRLQLHETPEFVLAGELRWTGECVRESLGVLADAAEWASDELSLLSFHEPGKSSIWVCHSGPTATAEAEIARLTSSCTPDSVTIAPTPFRDLSFARDGEYWPARVCIDHEIQAAVVPAAVTSAIQELLDAPSPGVGDGLRLVEVHPIYRQLSRAPRDLSAVRNGPMPEHWAVVPLAAWVDPGDDEAYRSWVLDGVSALRSGAAGTGVLLDCFGTNVMGSAASAYGASLPRLVELKRQWDPGNVFRANLNIDPANS